jgi:hypothetical protein
MVKAICTQMSVDCGVHFAGRPTRVMMQKKLGEITLWNNIV